MTFKAAYAGGGDGATTPGTTMTMTVPATVVDGDVAIIAVTVGSTSTTLTTPTGYTLVSGPDEETSGLRCYMFKRELAAADASGTVTFTASGSARLCGAGLVFSDVDYSQVASPAITKSGNTAITFPAVTATKDGDVAFFYLFNTGSATPPSVTLPGTPTPTKDDQNTTAFTSGNIYAAVAGHDSGSAGSYGGGTVLPANAAVQLAYALKIPEASMPAGGVGQIRKLISDLWTVVGRAAIDPGGGLDNVLPAFGLAPDTSGVGIYSTVKSHVPYLSPHRIYSNNVTPATYSASAAAGDPAIGAVSHISFKPDYATAATGAYNSWAHDFAQTCPEGTVFIFHHEPEDDGTTAATFVAGIEQIFGAIGSGSPVKRTTCSMEWWWKLGGGNSGSTYHWLDFDSGLVDVIGVDAYSQAFRGWGSLESICQPFFDWAETLHPGKERMVLEAGLETGWATAGLDFDYVEWFENAMLWGKDNGVTAIDLFDLHASGVVTDPWTTTMLDTFNGWLTDQGVYA